MLPAQAPTRTQYGFSGQLDRLTALSTTALSLESLVRAYAQADCGQPAAMINLWEQRIEVDAHLRSVLDERREGVARKPWLIQEGGDDDADKAAAAQLEAAIRRIPNFSATLEWQLQANPLGWAATEIDWQRVDGWTIPVGFVSVPAQRFIFDYDTDEPRLVSSWTDTRSASGPKSPITSVATAATGTDSRSRSTCPASMVASS